MGVHTYLVGRTLTILITSVLSPAALAADKPCAAPEYRQFDFWLGEWGVTLPDGKFAGTNRLTRVAAGCALHESWRGTKGIVGTSLTGYDAGSRKWRQTWVDSSGDWLDLQGEFTNGAMVLSDAHRATTQEATINRITWTQTGTRRVRQLWETSNDGGKTWQTAFDGRYQRVK